MGVIGFKAGQATERGSDWQLNWGDLARYENAVNLPPSMLASLEVARASLAMPVEPMQTFHIEGTLSQDPGHQEANRAKRTFPAIFDLAICSRVAPQPLRAQCVSKAAAALLSWAKTYRPGGNPINDAFFVPLLQAIDLVASLLPPPDASVLRGWTASFADAGDHFYRLLPLSNAALNNNWMSQRLLIRAMAAVICRDRGMQASTRDLLLGFARRNFLSDTGRRDGASYDFLQRDALEYHVADLAPLVQITLYTPGLVTPEVHGYIELGLSFLRDYYTGRRQHIEFAHTTNSFDIRRKLEDEHNELFQNKPWDPAGARILLRLARPAFPSVRSWTEDVLGGHYTTRVNLLAMLYEQAP